MNVDKLLQQWFVARCPSHG